VAADRLIVPDPRQATTEISPAETASAGFAVETHVLARLLGIKLLTLEGVVFVSPARVSRGSAADAMQIQTSSPRRQGPEVRSHPRTGGRETLPTGSALGDTARLLEQCAEDLHALDVDQIAAP